MKNLWLAVIFAIGCAFCASLIAVARSDVQLRQTIVVDLCLVGLGLVIVILGSISIFDKDRERWLALLFVGLLIGAFSAITFIGVVVIVPAAILLIALAISRILGDRIKRRA